MYNFICSILLLRILHESDLNTLTLLECVCTKNNPETKGGYLEFIGNN